MAETETGLSDEVIARATPVVLYGTIPNFSLYIWAAFPEPTRLVLSTKEMPGIRLAPGMGYTSEPALASMFSVLNETHMNLPAEKGTPIAEDGIIERCAQAAESLSGPEGKAIAWAIRKLKKGS